MTDETAAPVTDETAAPVTDAPVTDGAGDPEPAANESQGECRDPQCAIEEFFDHVCAGGKKLAASLREITGKPLDAEEAMECLSEAAAIVANHLLQPVASTAQPGSGVDVRVACYKRSGDGTWEKICSELGEGNGDAAKRLVAKLTQIADEVDAREQAAEAADARKQLVAAAEAVIQHEIGDDVTDGLQSLGNLLGNVGREALVELYNQLRMKDLAVLSAITDFLSQFVRRVEPQDAAEGGVGEKMAETAEAAASPENTAAPEPAASKPAADAVAPVVEVPETTGEEAA